MGQLVWVPRSLGSARVERREGGVWMGTYLRNSSRQEPQVPAPQPEIEARGERGSYLGAHPHAVYAAYSPE